MYKIIHSFFCIGTIFLLSGVFFLSPLGSMGGGGWGVFSPSWVFAETSQGPQIFALQKKPHQFDREYSLQFSYFPLDNFHLYYVLGGSFTYNITPYLSWEVLNAGSSRSSSTGLEEYLKTTFSAVPEVFDIMDSFGTTSILYTPVYMKSLYKGRSVVWGDLSFVFGYGLTSFQRTGSVNTSILGTKIRFYAYDRVSFNFDLRNFFFSDPNLRPNLGLGISISYYAGETRDTEEEKGKDKDGEKP